MVLTLPAMATPSIKQINIITLFSVICNFLALMKLSNYDPTMPSMRLEAQFSRISRYAALTYNQSNQLIKPTPHLINCSRTILFYGMRQHWKTFCSFPEFAHYKYMIEFPRTVECPDVDCSVNVHYTEDASDIKGHDIVVFTNVFDAMTTETWDWVHGNRSEGQIWAMITEESPLYVPGVQPPIKYANNTFDWVDSYNSHSEFVHSYGVYEPYGDDNRPPPIDIDPFFVNKTGLIAWMGSHCETLQWDRLRFVNRLKQIIQVDTYGKCGAKEVPWNNDQIILDTLGKYKFYLSLENSCCEEYITEKFWRALQMGLVPVVVGAPLEHYQKFAPPNSFIHMDQFDSMKELAIHLITLNSNKAKYLRHHKWRNEGKLVSYGQEEQYVRPLNNDTQCGLLSRLLKTDTSRPMKLEYFGPRWYGSCKSCGSNTWIDEFLHVPDHERIDKDIWAK